MPFFFRLYNKKMTYDPIDYACIDETDFWLVDEDEPRARCGRIGKSSI